MKAKYVKTVSKNVGYSLIELLFTIAVIAIGLGSLYAVLFRGMDHMKIIGGKNYAVVAASSELELVKAMAGDELPDEYDGLLLTGETPEGNEFMLGADNEFYPADDEYRLSGDVLEPVGPLGQVPSRLEPPGPLGEEDPYAQAWFE